MGRGPEGCIYRKSYFVDPNQLPAYYNADFFAGPPAVTSGSVWRHDVADAATGASAP